VTSRGSGVKLHALLHALHALLHALAHALFSTALPVFNKEYDDDDDDDDGTRPVNTGACVDQPINGLPHTHELCMK